MPNYAISTSKRLTEVQNVRPGVLPATGSRMLSDMPGLQFSAVLFFNVSFLLPVCSIHASYRAPWLLLFVRC